MRIKGFINGVLIGGLGLALSATAAQGSDFDRRYLALDQSLHGNLIDAQMVLGQADNHTLLWEGQSAWESSNSINPWGASGVIQGHDGVYRYYYGVRTPTSSFTAVATSTDGINWTKSEPLQPVMVNGSLGGGVVYYDAGAPASQRYKITWHASGQLWVGTSSDGLNFTTASLGTPAGAGERGPSSFFYDNLRDEWVIYGRERNFPTGDTDRRGIILYSSGNAGWNGVWPNAQVVVDPADLWTYTTHPNSQTTYPQGTGPDLYTSNVQIYHGQYIGIPSTFFRDPARVPYHRPDRVTGPIYPLLMHSLDGENWTFADLEQSILDLGPHLRVASWEHATNTTDEEVGQIYSVNFLDVDDQLLIYYIHADELHYEHPTSHPTPWNAMRSYYVASMRVDGFASIKADEGELGEWITSNDIEVPEGARGLLVNAKVDGSLKVEVRDTLGDVIGTLSLDDSVAFTGDELAALMKWQAGQFEQVAGQTVQLRFVVEDGEIYSFSFTTIPEPASLALLGLGGAMLLRRKSHYLQ
jgi:hypothetical protein